VVIGLGGTIPFNVVIEIARDDRGQLFDEFSVSTQGSPQRTDTRLVIGVRLVVACPHLQQIELRGTLDAYGLGAMNGKSSW
jgi:hypothetical protein